MALGTIAGSLEVLFWVCALAGTLFFILRVVMMVHGADGADDIIDHGAVGHAGSSDVAFEIISVNSITAFFMMFGWIGLTCYKQFAFGGVLSVVLAFLAGGLCMFITAYLFKLAAKLVSHGSVFTVKDTLGKTATVYQKIPANGRGKINVSVGDMLREIEAVSEEKEEIESFGTVTVVRVVDNNTVSVKKIK